MRMAGKGTGGKRRRSGGGAVTARVAGTGPALGERGGRWLLETFKAVTGVEGLLGVWLRDNGPDQEIALVFSCLSCRCSSNANYNSCRLHVDYNQCSVNVHNIVYCKLDCTQRTRILHSSFNAKYTQIAFI